MPYYIVFVKMDNGYSLQVLEAMDRIDQSAPHLAWQIDLRHIAGNNNLGAIAHAGQEHLHLVNGSVLAFVEDDDGLVQCATTHKRQRHNLDYVAIHIALDLLRFHHVVERIEQRPQVRINLGHDVAGQEAESLARFHGRPDKDDFAHLPLAQQADGLPDGEKCLAGPRGTDAKREIILVHRVNIAGLAVGAWTQIT